MYVSTYWIFVLLGLVLRNYVIEIVYVDNNRNFKIRLVGRGVETEESYKTVAMSSTLSNSSYATSQGQVARTSFVFNSTLKLKQRKLEEEEMSDKSFVRALTLTTRTT